MKRLGDLAIGAVGLIVFHAYRLYTLARMARPWLS